MDEEALLYDINQGGRVLHMPPWTLRAQIAAGNVKITRLGTRIMIPRSELERVAREGLPSLRIKVKAESDLERPMEHARVPRREMR